MTSLIYLVCLCWWATSCELRVSPLAAATLRLPQGSMVPWCGRTLLPPAVAAEFWLLRLTTPFPVVADPLCLIYGVSLFRAKEAYLPTSSPSSLAPLNQIALSFCQIETKCDDSPSPPSLNLWRRNSKNSLHKQIKQKQKEWEPPQYPDFGWSRQKESNWR